MSGLFKAGQIPGHRRHEMVGTFLRLANSFLSTLALRASSISLHRWVTPHWTWCAGRQPMAVRTLWINLATRGKHHPSLRYAPQQMMSVPPKHWDCAIPMGCEQGTILNSVKICLDSGGTLTSFPLFLCPFRNIRLETRIGTLLTRDSHRLKCAQVIHYLRGIHRQERRIN